MKIQTQVTVDIELKKLFKVLQPYIFVCENCSKVFLHTSLRDRSYCTNTCAALISSRKRRARIKKLDTDAYRKEKEAGRLRAKKSNERKKKRLLL